MTPSDNSLHFGAQELVRTFCRADQSHVPAGIRALHRPTRSLVTTLSELSPLLVGLGSLDMQRTAVTICTA